MEDWQIYMLVFGVLQTFFVFALGACVGSLTNVLVYRMPLGISVVTPPSRCPSCQTQLTWRENVPVLGWILLGGKCRFCKARISAEYPIVEAFVGCLFTVVYWLWFLFPSDWNLWGVSVLSLRPEWANEGISSMWPTLVVVLALLSALTAMTIVDAKTSMIPLPLAWAPTIFALLIHPLHAAWLAHTEGRLRHVAPDWTWTMATPGPNGWPLIGAALGGTLGVVIANTLLGLGIIKRSWSDYEQWERQHLGPAAPDITLPVLPGVEGEPPEPSSQVAMPSEAIAAKLPETSVHTPVSGSPEVFESAAADTPAASPLVDAGAPAAASGPSDPGSPSDLWLEYPHARREVLREALFLAPIIGFALAGAGLAAKLAGPWTYDVNGAMSIPAHAAPLWLDVLAGVLAGYLIGAGVVWVVRILGTLAFGKEAMGMGDVHLLAAVGAAVGWVDATIAFFGAAFVGLAYALVTAVFRKGFKRAMPYGPHIAVAAVLVIMLKPCVESFLTILLRATPPINLP